MNKRIEYIDKAKGIGILCVVFLHIALTKDFCGYTFWGGWIRTFFMPLFFITSGIFFHLGNIVPKVKRLLMPLLSFNFTALCFYSGKDLLHGENIDVVTMLLDFFGLSCNYPPNPPLWFLLSLIEILVMAHFMIKFIKSSWVIVLSLILGFIGYLLGARFGKMPLSVLPSLMCLPHFTIGYYLKDRILSLKFGIYLVALLLSIGIFMVQPVIPTLSDAVIPQGYILFFLSSFLGGIGIYGICRIINGYVGQIIDYFGRNSLIVLSTHWFFLSIPYHVLNIVHNSMLAAFVGFGIILLVEIPIVYFINHKMSFLLGK